MRSFKPRRVCMQVCVVAIRPSWCYYCAKWEYRERIMKTFSLTTAKVLRIIADEKSMGIFRTIFSSGGGIDSEDLQGKTNLTRKEYYTRLASMVKAGLVMKTDGRYGLTAFGNVVFDSQLMVENGITNFWRLKAIDSFYFKGTSKRRAAKGCRQTAAKESRDQRNYWKVMTFDRSFCE